MLVEQPHDLGRVHRGAATDRDDRVGLELLAHHLGAALDGLDGGLRLDVVDDSEGDAIVTGAQLVDDLVDDAELLHHLVAHDDGLLDAVHVAQVLDGVRLEVRLGRNLEPLHVIVPPSDALDVDQVHGLDVAGHRVAAVGAAAQGQRRGNRVVDVADAAERARLVPDDAAGVHAQAVLAHQRLVVRVDGGGVAGTELEHLLAHLEGLLLVVGLEHGLHRGELLVGQRLVVGDLLAFGGEDRRVGGDLEAGGLGDELRGLARHHGVEDRLLAGAGGAAEHVLLQLRLLVRVDEVCLAALELLDERRVDVLVGDNGLLGGADHAVIEVLGEDQVVRRTFDVHIGIDVGRSVAGADAEGGLAGGVRGLDHAGAAGGQDGGDARVLHQRAGRLDGRVFDPLHAVLGCACFDRGVADDLRGGHGRLLGARVEAEHDRTAGLECQQRLEDGGGGRVGDRGDTGDDADRLGDLVYAHDLVLADQADGLLPGHVVGDVLAGEDVLGGLVFDETTAGLIDGHLREHQMLVQGRDGRLGDDAVDLLLIELLELVKGLETLLDKGVDLGFGRRALLLGARLGGRLDLCCFCHEYSSTSCGFIPLSLPPSPGGSSIHMLAIAHLWPTSQST